MSDNRTTHDLLKKIRAEAQKHIIKPAYDPNYQALPENPADDDEQLAKLRQAFEHFGISTGKGAYVHIGFVNPDQYKPGGFLHDWYIEKYGHEYKED